MGCLSGAAWLPRWGLSVTCLSRQAFTRRCSVAQRSIFERARILLLKRSNYFSR